MVKKRAPPTPPEPVQDKIVYVREDDYEEEEEGEYGSESDHEPKLPKAQPPKQMAEEEPE